MQKKNIYKTTQILTPLRDITRELGQRWNRETGFTSAQDNSTWYSRHHLQEEDKWLQH